MADDTWKEVRDGWFRLKLAWLNLRIAWGKMQDAAFVLEHNCGGPGWAFKDLAVWNDKGEKIKSEWD